MAARIKLTNKDFRRARRLVSGGEAANALLTRIGAGDQLKFLRLWAAWRDLFGEELAELARPLGHRGRVLLIGMEDPIVGQELTFFVPLILERVNEFLGQECFDKVAFELIGGRVPLDERPAPEPPPSRPERQPPRLSGVGELLEKDTPVARAYRAWLERSRGSRDET